MYCRKVNSVTKDEIAVLPKIHEIFDSLGEATIFTILDLKAAYWQVKLSKKSREKSAFITHRGIYEFLRMPFGLKNGHAVFQ